MDVTQSEYIDVYESVDSESVLIRFKREPDGNVFVNIHDLKAAFKDATGLREEVVRNGKTRWAIYGPSSTGIIYIGSTTSRYMPQRNGKCFHFWFLHRCPLILTHRTIPTNCSLSVGMSIFYTNRSLNFIP